ncbi:collagen-like protein [Cutibacterium avidum]|uniref:collagen-like protein n=1 Tax=Cutibacterium avidum TaxID=33010 RepID=UPI00280CD082|nr:collagen-like protein [Cutibacterium avidum]MDQ9080054.1 collagen-like protein [Cutibacterium avidum]
MPPTNELETERRQRQSSERLNVWQAAMLALLVVVVAALTGWAGHIQGQRDAAGSQAASNADAAKSLAGRVKAACATSTDEGRSLRQAGLCDEASRVESRVRGAPAPTGQAVPGPAGPVGASGQPGRSVTGPAGRPGRDATGKAGAAGRPGKDATGAAGKDATGQAGADSTVPGPKGDKGDPGQPGRDATGAPGKDGADGKDGRGLASLACDDGHLVATFTDGTTSTVTGATVCATPDPSPIPTATPTP